MSMFLKIHEGTGQSSGKSMCESCTYAAITNGITRCQQNWQHPLLMVEPIYSCNRYYNKNLPNLKSLEELAWTLKTDGGRKVGFVPPDPKKD